MGRITRNSKSSIKSPQRVCHCLHPTSPSITVNTREFIILREYLSAMRCGRYPVTEPRVSAVDWSGGGCRAS
jgi:hypothetical protein